jgi:hypothetical protein
MPPLYPTEPHSAIIVGRTGCGKTRFVLDLLEGPYRGAFDWVAIVCPTLKDNRTYRERPWIRTDPHVILVDPGERLHDWIRALSNELRGESVLFILDDLSADKAIKKKRDALSELVFSGRHRGHSVWSLSQKYNAISTDLRENTQWVACFACKDRDSFEEVLRENDAVPAAEHKRIREQLASTKHGKLVLRTCFPPCY